MSELPPMVHLTDEFSAAPHPPIETLAALAAAGYRTVICNRPDSEVAPGERAAEMEAAARAAGMEFAVVEVTHDGIKPETIEAQRLALSALPGPHFGYCRAGFRSSVVWALAMAGDRPTDEIMAALRRAGFAMPGLERQIEALAATR
ncbi:TIGR01244 family sulfur transferase [Rhodovulum tesquicola]|uniref:TIGR01244 family sulfur transferase n=1 Tax=Rhodovulum tesquicola TaxID=540254 RepID=UPI00209748F5|nr:TIGR01244 family sulfur transferase [Rhodovulum tesquicola]MCO8146395.1 TIGR01244 family sulfur transferase [Rhodovulum tesquicola]